MNFKDFTLTSFKTHSSFNYENCIIRLINISIESELGFSLIIQYGCQLLLFVIFSSLCDLKQEFHAAYRTFSTTEC